RSGSASFAALEPLGQLAPQLLTLFLVKFVLLSIGFFLLLLPGVYLAVLFCFAELYVALERKTFWEALQASRALVHGNFFPIFAPLVVLSLLALSGFLLVGIGALATFPLALLAFYCVFRQLNRVILPEVVVE